MTKNCMFFLDNFSEKEEQCLSCSDNKKIFISVFKLQHVCCTFTTDTIITVLHTSDIILSFYDCLSSYNICLVVALVQEAWRPSVCKCVKSYTTESELFDGVNTLAMGNTMVCVRITGKSRGNVSFVLFVW